MTKEFKGTFWDDGNILYVDHGDGYLIKRVSQFKKPYT